MKEFLYCFQISKLIVFFVEYITLGSNKNPYFSTSAGVFSKGPKTDYHSCGQCQKRLPDNSTAYKFYKKWDRFHLKKLTDEQFEELRVDLKTLENEYNFICEEKDTFANLQNASIPFYSVVELSKMKVKKRQNA